MATANPVSPLPMFGAYNEHWANHPAGLPVSRYKPGTNPNTGAASVDAAYKAYQDSLATTPPPATTPTTPATPKWNEWVVDFREGQTPASNTPAAANPSPTAGTTTADFASRYTPALMQQAYENPWYILGDVFEGINPNSPLYQSLRDMGADPLSLFNILEGSQGLNTGGAKDFVNWLAQTYQGQGTPGGSPFSADSLIKALFGQEDFGSQSKSTLGQILGAGDMATQIRTLYNLARDASNVSMNPLAARAYQSSLAQAGDQYGDTMMQSGASGTMNPTEWIRQNAPWLTLGT